MRKAENIQRRIAGRRKDIHGLEKHARHSEGTTADTTFTTILNVFIIIPLIMTAILGCGFIWIEELTVLDARKLYTPVSALSWKEEHVMNELWPVKPQEFLPERTFEWRRYLYLVVHGRLNEDGSYPNILN
ncbi:hypothetical protein TELCIR_20572, partial [Teladorsagia circumcincta]